MVPQQQNESEVALEKQETEATYCWPSRIILLCTRHPFLHHQHTANTLPQLKSICRSCLSQKCSNSKCFPSCTKYSKLIQKEKKTMFHVAIPCTIILLESISGDSTTGLFNLFLGFPLKHLLSHYIFWNAAHRIADRGQHFILRSFLQWKNSHLMIAFRASRLAIERVKDWKAVMNSQGYGVASHKQLFSPWQWTKGFKQGVQASSQDSNVSIFTPSCAFPLSSSFSSWASDAFGSTHLLGTAITAYGWNASGSHILSAEHRQNSHGYYITLLSFNKPTNNNNNNKKKKTEK